MVFIQKTTHSALYELSLHLIEIRDKFKTLIVFNRFYKKEKLTSFYKTTFLGFKNKHVDPEGNVSFIP